MEQQKHLEDFRLNEYLVTYLMLMSDSNNPKVEMTYNDYTNHAFYGTSYDLQDLENEKNFINNGRRVLPTISLWYLSLEAYINALCKITCLTLNADPEPLLNKDIGSRLSYLMTALEYDDMAIKRTGIYNRLNDFRQFRNELFHDRNTGDQIVFKKTNFSAVPIMSNQVDIFQALLIFLEIAVLFRFCIPGIDLMPNIAMGNSQVLHFDKLDLLYAKYLRPNFEAVLAKHSLSTQLDLNTLQFQLLPQSGIFNQGEIVVIGRIEQEERFKHSINQSTTTIGRDLYNQIVKDYNLPHGHNSNLNFIIDYPEFHKSRYLMRR